MVASVEVRDLSFGYGRRSPSVISSLSHRFPGGQITALTGESGAGKSTLLYLVGLLLRPGEGEILINDVLVSEGRDGERSSLRARHVGFVFQDSALDASRSALDNAAMPALYHGARVREARTRAAKSLHRVGLGDRLSHRPGELSGGQAQRVALSRALINEPTVVLADEPTGNLDARNSQMVLESLRAVSRLGRVVVIATHDPVVVAASDRVLVL